MTLNIARAVVRHALAAGRAQTMMPLTVAVLDAGGHLVALEREDGSGIMRVEIAIGKAYGALGFGVDSRTLRDRFNDRPNFVSGLSAASGGRFVPVPGGVLIYPKGDDLPGQPLGAVGISGDTSDRDEFCAITSVHEAGLVPSPAQVSENWQDSHL